MLAIIILNLCMLLYIYNIKYNINATTSHPCSKFLYAISFSFIRYFILHVILQVVFIIFSNGNVDPPYKKFEIDISD
jgi:hypothetical protein